MSTNFKTCLFGGFDREDVISYIEQSSRESQERIDELMRSNEDLAKQIDELTRQNEELTGKLAELQETADKYTATAESFEALQDRSGALVKRIEDLTAENESLRSQAQDYQSLKDHIAEIEISAHRRTEEFRAAAIAKLHDLVSEQRGWCAERREQYAAAHESVAQQIRAAQEALGTVDLSGFDQMDEKLQELANSLEE